MMLIEINIYLCMIKVYTFITCLHQLHLLIILLLLLFKRVMENVISCQWINKRIVIVIVIVIVNALSVKASISIRGSN